MRTIDLSTDELLAGLAEEASELAQAALKYRRALTGENPTPVSGAEALNNLLEEIADVELYLDQLGYGYSDQWASQKINRIKEHKLQRWKERL